MTFGRSDTAGLEFWFHSVLIKYTVMNPLFQLSEKCSGTVVRGFPVPQLSAPHEQDKMPSGRGGVHDVE